MYSLWISSWTKEELRSVKFFPGLLYLVQGGAEVATHLVEEARPCVFSIKQGLAYFQFDCSEDFGAELNGIFAVTKFAPFPCQYDVSIRAHNLCHDNRQLIVLAINCNHLDSKNNCN